MGDKKQLPIRVSEVVVERAPDDHDYCNKRILALEQECGALQTKYAQLQQIYNKLADQWNVFQATSRPDNRNIQRAEGAGEMARKLAEVLLGVAYATDVRDLLQKILQDMGDAGGREVEVGGQLVKSTRRG